MSRYHQPYLPANLTRRLSLFISSLLLLALSACSNLTSQQSQSMRDFAANSNLNEWQVRGKIGFKTSDGASSGYLNWRQCGEQFEIRINGPLGSGAAKLAGDNHRVTLYENGKPPVAANTAEQLLQMQLGWQIPVSELVYWIRGTPSPKHRFRNTELGFQQSGWVLTYPRQTAVNDLLLPAKAIAQSPQATVTLVIQQWQLDTACGLP